MCGLAGIFSPTRQLSQDILEKMSTNIQHRGPDDHGVWYDAQSGLGLSHRRLAILDLSPAGHQPMVSASERFVIAFNGEIYNHLELRRELEHMTLAIPWRGHSDTETLLTGFEAWGIVATLKRAVGMFALAVWDRHSHTLSLGRDRLGEKPLYYGWNNGMFLFCSELKALHGCENFRPDIDCNALSLFLRYNYIPAPYSIYRGIYKLWPGTILTLGATATVSCPWDGVPTFPPFSTANLSLTPFWSMLDTAERGVRAPLSCSERDQINALEAILHQAIIGQMISDVPLGALLSGGVDSSTIVALMQAQCTNKVKTFSIGFHEADFNEANYAKHIARHLGTDHTELYVTPKEALDVIPNLATLYDEPFADSSQIPTFLVTELARRHVTVALSGDAGDELFGGYNRYFWAKSIWRNVGWLPKRIRRLLAAGMVAVTPEASDRLYPRFASWLPSGMRFPLLRDKVHKLADIFGEDSPEAVYLALQSQWKDPTKVISGAYEPMTIMTNPHQRANLPNFEEQMMFLDAMAYLPDDILVKLDRAAMGVSLETRVPFLDHRVVEFAWRLPLSSKINNGQGKWILRQVLYKYVPKHLVERPKAGFAVPIGAWLRGPLRDWAEELLAERRLQLEGFFHPALIREKWEEHLAGKRDWKYLIWNVLMFQSWLQALCNNSGMPHKGFIA
jgi:asparagine synthase (glutamine-hydrolysing)